jgi:hypothetical protein
MSLFLQSSTVFQARNFGELVLMFWIFRIPQQTTFGQFDDIENCFIAPLHFHCVNYE